MIISLIQCRSGGRKSSHIVGNVGLRVKLKQRMICNSNKILVEFAYSRLTGQLVMQITPIVFH